MFPLGRHALSSNREVLKIPLVKQFSNEFITHSSKLSSHALLLPILYKNTIGHGNVLTWFRSKLREQFSKTLLNGCSLFGLKRKKPFHSDEHPILTTGPIFQCRRLGAHRLLLTLEQFSSSRCADDIPPMKFSLHIRQGLLKLVDVVSGEIQLLTKLHSLTLQSLSLSTMNHRLTNENADNPGQYSNFRMRQAPCYKTRPHHPATEHAR